MATLIPSRGHVPVEQRGQRGAADGPADQESGGKVEELEKSLGFVGFYWFLLVFVGFYCEFIGFICGWIYGFVAVLAFRCV